MSKFSKLQNAAQKLSRIAESQSQTLGKNLTKSRKKLTFWYKILGIPALIIIAYFAGQVYLKETPDNNTHSKQLLKSAESEIVNNPKKAHKLAKKAQQSSYQTGNISKQIQSLLLQAEAEFDRGNRSNALKILASINKRVSNPQHIVNAKPESQAYFNLGLARIMLRNQLPAQGLEKAKLSLRQFSKANIGEVGAEEILELAKSLQQQGKSGLSAALYNLVALHYKRYGLLSRSAIMFERAADIVKPINMEKSHLLYRQALETLLPIYKNAEATTQQYERAKKKMLALPPEATERLYY